MQRCLRFYLLPGVLYALLCCTLVAMPTLAHQQAEYTPDLLRQVDFEQRLHAVIPLELTFRDDTGQQVRLGEYFHARPVILTLAYYRCPNLCTLVLNGLVRTLRTLAFTAGEEFTVVTVSIDPRDTPTLAAAKKAHYLRSYGRAAAATGWHFLTGDAAAIQQLTQAVGFQYAYDAAHDQFAHASGVVLLTSQGVVARYLYGIEYAPKDLRLGLVEAAAHRLGSPIDKLLLLCYHYDPQTGKYGLVIMQVIRLAGLATVLSLGVLVGVLFRRERGRSRQGEEQEEQEERG
jgi:protein SCO1/2